MGFEIENGILTKYTEEPGMTVAVVPDGVTCIGEAAFYGSKKLRSVTFPESLTDIGEFAFGKCLSLQSVTLPAAITSIKAGVFRDCYSLRITLPEGVKEIGWWAFVNCESVVLPDSVTCIGDHAFDNCKRVLCREIELEYNAFMQKWEDMTKLVRLIAVRDFTDVLRTSENPDAKISPAMCAVLWKMQVFDPEDAEVTASLNLHPFEAFAYLADQEDETLLEQALATELFQLEECIDALLEYVHQQGKLDIWLILMNYKNEKIGYDTAGNLSL